MLCIVYSLLYYIYSIRTILYIHYTIHTHQVYLFILSSEHIYSYILYTIYTILYYTDTTTTTTRTLAAQTSTTPQLPPADAVRLKNQSFVRPERVKEVLENLQSVLLQRVPDLKALMKV